MSKEAKLKLYTYVMDGKAVIIIAENREQAQTFFETAFPRRGLLSGSDKECGVYKGQVLLYDHPLWKRIKAI